MCGRFALRTPPNRLAQEFHVTEVPEMEARYNIAPAQAVLAVRGATGGREAKLLRWGLIPSWAKDGSLGAKLINARSETVEEKPAFREGFKHRPCIIPADGFYEWKRMGNRKQPYFFRLRDERLLGFAGIWEEWRDDGETIESCTILTTAANEAVSPMHERMPVILRHEDYDLWLDEDVRKLDLVKELLQPYPAPEMISYPVSTLINRPMSQGEKLIEPVHVE